MTAETKAPFTEYVILTNEASLWDECSRVNARSAEAAIRSLKTAGVYVAIPARSFQPVKVTAEVQTTLKITAA